MSSGKAKAQAGKAKQELGKRLGDEDLEAEGREERIEGKARQAGEAVRDTFEGFRKGLRGEDEKR